MTTQLNTYRGTEIADYAHHLTRLRLQAFSEFPYLYVGNEKEDLEYTQEYASDPQGLLILATQNGKVIGAFSGIPLGVPAASYEGWSDAFSRNGVEVHNTYYAGEMIIDPAFQKLRCFSSLLNRFFQEVRGMDYQKILFVTCYREEDHPMRPDDYATAESNWSKVGAQKTDIHLPFTWLTRQEDGTAKMQDNKLVCWLRDTVEPDSLRGYTG